MEAITRFAAFSGVFAVVALLEWVAPRRKLSVSKSWRWLTNLSLMGLDIIIVRLFFGAVVVKTALFAQSSGWGVLNYLQLPGWLEFSAAVIFLDLMIYIQHVLFHAVPLFWRFHLVHHTDLDFDVTTAGRFHPMEIVVSLLYKTVLIIVSGAPPGAVLLFEIILNGSAQFNHSNLKLPLRLDRVLRGFIITPDFHRVHHFINPVETNSNYGFFLPYWDYLGGTYLAQPALSHREMSIGLKRFRKKEDLTLPSLIALPFTPSAGQSGGTYRK